MRVVLLAAAAALAVMIPEATIPQTLGKSAGEVNFANSGSPAAQQAFQRGVALLHNFEYPRAAAAFQEAQKADPDFALAYWGEAMAHNHPVWMQQDADKGRAALAKLGATREQRLAKATTARERGLLEAVETLYGDGSKEDRDRAYSAKMEALHRDYSADVDIGSLYALSLLGLAHEGRDYGLYMRSAAVLEDYFPSHRKHPGVLHYLIHSYDDPAHAPLGLRAARLYGEVAPDAPHALHMTSHIFIAMGDWRNTIAANEAAMTASTALRAAENKPPYPCGHSLEWLNYAHFQVNEPAKSEAILGTCQAAAVKGLSDTKAPNAWLPVRSFSDMWVRHIVEGGNALTAGLTVSPAQNAVAAFNFAYGDVLRNRGKASALGAALGRLRTAAAAVKLKDEHPLMAKRQDIILAQARGLEALASGKREAGLAALHKAAELERVMAPDFGPPLVEKPSFELLGEELLAAGRTKEATEAFRQALKMAPGRRISSAQLAKLETGQPDGTRTAAAAPHKH